MGISNSFVSKAGLTPVIMYPVPVYGISDTKVRKLRATWASSPSGWRRGNSTALTLRFCRASDLDPLFGATLLPLLTYAKYVKEAAQDEDLYGMLRKTWHHALSKLAAKGWKWGQVKGPTTATILTLRRIDWSYAHPFVLQEAAEQGGKDFKILECPRGALRIALRERVSHLLLARGCRNPNLQADDGSELSPSFVAAPIDRLLGQKSTMDFVQQMALRPVVNGGIWCLDRTKEAGFILDDKC